MQSRVGIFISGTIGLQNLLYMDKTNGSNYSAAACSDLMTTDALPHSAAKLSLWQLLSLTPSTEIHKLKGDTK